MIIFVNANKLNDQKNNKGVSVDIMKLPKPVNGNVLQIKAANLPALFPKIFIQVIQSIIEIKKCNIGENSLTASSSEPKTKVENEINHAINGGLEK